MKDKKPPDKKCDVCGHVITSEYRSFNVYHNDVEWSWTYEHHDDRGCIRELAKRIAKLEKNS